MSPSWPVHAGRHQGVGAPGRSILGGTRSVFQDPRPWTQSLGQSYPADLGRFGPSNGPITAWTSLSVSRRFCLGLWWAAIYYGQLAGMELVGCLKLQDAGAGAVN